MAKAGTETIKRVYQQLWTDFRKTCHSVGRVTKPQDNSAVVVMPAPGNQIQVTTAAYLQNWPFRATSPRKHVDILVASDESYSHYQDRKITMLKSAVRVAYLRRVESDAKEILSVHYDFENPAKSAHPLFHAQLGRGDFDDVLQKVGFSGSIEWLKEKEYSNLRIPTPCMNLGSVLLGLAADHLGSPGFAGVQRLVRNSDFVKYQANCETLKRSLRQAEDCFLHSYHWY